MITGSRQGICALVSRFMLPEKETPLPSGCQPATIMIFHRMLRGLFPYRNDHFASGMAFSKITQRFRRGT